MVTINRGFNLGVFEQALAEIANGDPNLRLANRIKAEAVGGIAALVQLIITWARKTEPNGDLQIYARSLKDPALEHFSRTVTGLVALNLAHQIHSVDGHISFGRSEAMEVAIPFVEAMHARSLEPLREFSKSTIPLLCIDNAKQLRRPIRLYKNAEAVRDRSEFADLLHACFKLVGPDHYAPKGGRLMEATARLIYEAFLNTHEHAQSDFRGDRLKRSVRGVLVGYRAIDLDQLAGMAGEHRPLRDHFEGWRPSNQRMRTAQFIDISVFDSGSGLAQTWLWRKGQIRHGIREDGVPLQDELRAVLGCLRKGGSIKPGHTSGNGLYRIMEVVRRAGGFIRIRSGRLSLVKAFPFDAPALDPANIMVEDAVAGGVPRQARAWADGTTISVLLPLNRGPDQ